MEVKQFIHQSMMLKLKVVKRVTALKHVVSARDVEDAYDTVILEHLEKPERVQKIREPILGYLIACTKNRLFDLWRREHRDREVVLAVDDDDDEEKLCPLEELPDPVDFVAQIEAADILEKVSPRERQSSELIMAGYTQEEVAAILDISRWSVRTNLERLREKFR